MINVKNRDEISDTLWNTCVEKSHNEAIYGYTWFLDCIAPNWMGIIVGDYEAVLPLIFKQKYGISYLCQTSFLQRTAIYSLKPLNQKVIKSIFSAIPSKFVRWDFCVDEKSVPAHHGFIKKTKRNLILNLNQSYDGISSGYGKNTKRNIKSAQKNNLSFLKLSKPNLLLETYKSNAAKNSGYGLSDKDYERMYNFIQYCIQHKKGEILAAYKEDIFLGAVFFAHSKTRNYYLFSGVNDAGKNAKALFAIVDNFIQTHQNQPAKLDFEGSMNEGVARFYSGFGAEVETYYHLQCSILDRFFTFVRFNSNKKK